MSKFAFSSATIGSTTIADTDFVYGPGQFSEEGWDAENNTADGLNRRDRITQYGQGRMLVYGNLVSVATPASIPSLGVAITMLSEDGRDISETGVVVSATYIDSKKATDIVFDTNPKPPAT